MKANPNTSATISYQTTPVYNANETIPRGSIVDIKSSDNTLNTEVVIINSAEGLEIDYASGTPISSTSQSVQSAAPKPSSSEPIQQQAPQLQNPHHKQQLVTIRIQQTVNGPWRLLAWCLFLIAINTILQ